MSIQQKIENMQNLLITYNNDSTEELHDFFEGCADDAKQFCVDNGHSYSSVYPPDLEEKNVCPVMKDYTLCFIAAHGDADGVYNSDYSDVLSVRTTNYEFADKTVYAVACNCGQNLCQELKRLGLKLFVGYDDLLFIIESEPSFRESAMEGLKALLEGETKQIAYNRMYTKYTESITNAQSKQIKMLLLHNREHLCFK